MREIPRGESTVSIASMSSANADRLRIRQVQKIFAEFNAATKAEKPLDVMLGMLDFMHEVVGCTKASIFPVGVHTREQVLKAAEKRGCLFEVPYKDEGEAIKKTAGIAAIARNSRTLSEGLMLSTLRVFHEDFKVGRMRKPTSTKLKFHSGFPESLATYPPRYPR